MKIAVISDIHENFHNLILALNIINEREVDQIICLGDLMNTGVAKILSIQKMPSHLIWGNNDGEKVEIVTTALRPQSNLTCSLSTYDFLEYDGRKIFATHYDDLAVPMAKSGLYDAVFYGHNHILKVDKIGDVHCVNPGEIAAQKTGTGSFIIYDTKANEIETIILENIVTLKSDLTMDYFNKHIEELGFRSKDAMQLKSEN
ncbi:MAG: YfcE family phosphodiesterase [Saprospiraceae bacterium]|nr:YfcE family phosphodiesterase [Bacteroidia bacterium]NNL93414.1 YfcE family phosphodiesterase [Saprospiraceae bacterium]